MPIHDWTRVDVGIYHDFHEDWTIEIRRTLNAGLLPPGYLALADSPVNGVVPDVIALRLPDRPVPTGGPAGVAVAERPPALRQFAQVETPAYHLRANRVVIRNSLGRLVSVIEVVSPGNKDSRHALRSLVDKVTEFLRAGVHVLVVDLFPPTPRDPEGIHQLIWQELTSVPFEARPADKPLTVAAYPADGGATAYVEPLAVGDELPEAPVFLGVDWYVPLPLEATYRRSWDLLPGVIRDLVAPPT